MNNFKFRSSPKSLQHIIAPMITPIIRRRGIAQASIILDWEKIVQELSDVCWPMKLRFPREKNTEALLYLWVKSGTAIRLEYSQDIIIERINCFFGYKAVSALKFVQTTFQGSNTAKSMIRESDIPLTDNKTIAPATYNLADIDCDKLQQVLTNLGNAIRQKQPKAP